VAAIPHRTTARVQRRPQPGGMDALPFPIRHVWGHARSPPMQRGRCNRLNSSRLLPLREFVSPDAGVCWVSCQTLLYFTHSNVGVCRDCDGRELGELRGHARVHHLAFTRRSNA